MATLDEVAKRLEEEKQKEDNTQNAIYQAIIGLAPTLIGAAVGGKRGALAGSQAGEVGMKTLSASREAAKKEEEKKKELALSAEKESKKEQKEAEKFAFEKAKFEKEMAQKRLELASKPEAGTGGKSLTSEQSEKLAGHEASFKQLTDLRSAIQANADIMGPIAGRVAAVNPYATSSRALEALTKVAAQNIGKSLEGGKLTDEDILRYQRMLPQSTDTPDVALAKIDQIERLVAQRQSAEIDTLQRAGYGVNRFATRTPKEVELLQNQARADIPALLGAKEAQAAPMLDPMVESVARDNGISYQQAEYILKKRGYGAKTK